MPRMPAASPPPTIAGRQIYGRPIPQVLLLHVGAFDAEMIGPLLTAYEAQGVEWITLDEALADPIYADVPTEDEITQGTLLDLMIEARGVAAPPRIGQPAALLDALCPSPRSPADAARRGSVGPRATMLAR
jgi:peptidoglycan-N-acetylglucosamine deacetylase